MPRELISEERQQAIEQWLGAHKQWQVKQTIPLSSESAEVLAGVGRAILVHESFMPPVKSILKLIKQIRVAAPDTGLAVALVGKPSHDPLGAPPSRTDYDVWHARLLSLADPNIDFFSFREPQH
jgi:hypothetical protein